MTPLQIYLESIIIKIAKNYEVEVSVNFTGDNPLYVFIRALGNQVSPKTTEIIRKEVGSFLQGTALVNTMFIVDSYIGFTPQPKELNLKYSYMALSITTLALLYSFANDQFLPGIIHGAVTVFNLWNILRRKYE